MNSYSAKVTRTVEMSDSGSQGNFEEPISVIADSTGKFRVESKGMMHMTMVYDGNAMWMYMPTANMYSKLPLNGASTSARAGMGNGMSRGANAMEEYKNVSIITV
ncbi:MAG: hypothetical protein DMG40_21365 [Acidobacteria bacterium]|nr:MAG: hypothetical protein DMG40_21365 [Acidobacteriota bacterium]